jgi:hypothetical protein
LIYTPAGYSIKDGQRVPPIAADDHHNHVHVALDLGKPGPGIGDGTGKDKQIIATAASRGGISPSILYGVWGTESNFSHGPGPMSPAGAIGPFQFMPATASGMGVNPRDFVSSAFGAARYLGQYKGRGVSGMLAAYNAGPAGNPNNSETQAYIPKVLAIAKRWSGGVVAGGGSSGAAARGRVVDPRTSASPVSRGTIGATGIAFDPTGSLNINTPGRPTRVGLPDAFGSAGNLESSLAATNLAITEAGPDVARANAARQRQRAAIVERITALRRALRKRRLSRGKRIQYQNELADLIGAARQIDADVADSTPAPAGPDTTPVDTPAPLTEFDFSDLRIAQAALTDDPSDDLSALGDRRQKVEAALGAAAAAGDVPGQISLLGELKGLNDSIKGLQDQMDQDAEQRRQEEEARRAAEQAHTDALNAVADELKMTRQRAEQFADRTDFQLGKALAEMLTGQFGAMAQRRSFTPGSGRAVAY